MWHIEFINVFFISSWVGRGSWLLCIARDDEKNDLIYWKLSSIWMKILKMTLHACNLNWIKIESHNKNSIMKRHMLILAFLYAYKGLRKGVSELIRLENPHEICLYSYLVHDHIIEPYTWLTHLYQLRLSLSLEL